MIFLGFFKAIGLYFKVLNRFRPYFSNREINLSKLVIVDAKLDDDIIDIYNKLSKLPSCYYRKERRRYNSFVSSIDKHNDEVKYILSVIEAWDFIVAIENPYGVDKEYFDKCLNVCELLKNYKKLTEEQLSFINEVNRFKDEFEEICLEYDFLMEYEKLFDLDKYGYINKEEKREILRKAESMLSEFEHKTGYYKYDKHEHIDELVEEHNKTYIELAIKNPLFDDINQRSLDHEQRTAVVTDENSVLVVAGAGSGKTLTICGKVEYLLKEEKVNPNDILLLSYSKKSADDLQNKISKIDGRLTVGTFHKIGLDILKEKEHKIFAVEDQYKAIIEAYFRDELKNRPNMLRAILTYYGLYLNNTRHVTKYNDKGELYEDLRKSDFDTLKDQLLSLTNDINARETIKRELVKSFEEMAIANWYFINGIEYLYEGPYEIDLSSSSKRQYLPDFTIKDYHIYHEHYGVDAKGNASQYEGEEALKYAATMKWKREVHSTFGTDCIETYSYEFEDGTIFTKLEKELKKRGVEFNPLTDEQILQALNSIYEGRAFKSFINLIRTFLSLYKAQYQDDTAFNDLKENTFRNYYEKRRADLFICIVKDVYNYYMDYLRGQNKIDFDDMILKSMNALDTLSGFKFKYIIVDEFQDISLSRMKFLKRLIKQGSAKLFAVGDDWQAIYRFSGCDLNIFLDFGTFFGDSEIVNITTTHRNSQELQDIAGPFIKKNPEQFDKTIYSERHLKHPVQVMYSSGEKYIAFLDILRAICRMNREASVLVLGRNNKDFEDIALDDRIFIDFRASTETETIIKCVDYPKMKIKYSTVHGSKGLEDDYVILINADDRNIGFPNKMEDDELLDLVLSSKSEYEYAEERRLWYVALTRTKSYTFIIADIVCPSIFLEEIIDQCLIMNPSSADNFTRSQISCPSCKSGRLIMRERLSDGSSFLGCSNYPYCKYTIDDFVAVKRGMKCPNCGDFMIYKKGRWGSFYGCHNYPVCRFTSEYNKRDE